MLLHRWGRNKNGTLRSDVRRQERRVLLHCAVLLIPPFLVCRECVNVILSLSGRKMKRFPSSLARLREHSATDDDGEDGDHRLRHGRHASLPALRLQHGRLPSHLLPMGLRQPLQMQLPSAITDASSPAARGVYPSTSGCPSACSTTSRRQCPAARGCLRPVGFHPSPAEQPGDGGRFIRAATRCDGW